MKPYAVAAECSGERADKMQAGGTNCIDGIPDDLVLFTLAKLAASASSPADLLSVHTTCKRLNALGGHDNVLANASPASLAVKTAAWSEPMHRYLKRCADAGNLEACYIIGMIRFYCLGSRRCGVALLAKAAIGGHPAAVYSLAVIKFNGSGGSRDDRDLIAGAALCARSAALGYVDAIRELGHCLQDGYGVRRDHAGGRRLIATANERELTLSLEREPHAANRFMSDWSASRGMHACHTDASCACIDGELCQCSNRLCGRKETRRHEFRRCSACGVAKYCSRACQSLDWKRAHKAQCVPIAAAAGDAAAQ